jgi:hypothetical protein
MAGAHMHAVDAWERRALRQILLNGSTGEQSLGHTANGLYGRSAHACCRCMGEKGTQANTAERFYWRTITEDVKEFVSVYIIVHGLYHLKVISFS